MAAENPLLFSEVKKENNTQLISRAIPSKVQFNSLTATQFFPPCKLLFMLVIPLTAQMAGCASFGKMGNRLIMFV